MFELLTDMGRPKASEADPLRKAKRGRPSKQKREEHAVVHTGFDGHANAPWRKTVSIFKQPVTLVHTSGRDTKKGTELQLKRGLSSSRPQEKPAPIMWAKALENVQALIPTAVADKVDVNKTEYLTESLHLAGRLERASSILNEQAAAATLFTSIHNPNQSGAFGQTAEKEKLESNILLHVNSEQPLLRVS
ncbi:unnamed protein product [Nippostrongylus brasiliensis]|uniref:Methyl-binding protein-2 (inferred by orthology to a C. elegans protein) n=1 Tax=Nippostrongylus brasiliensis TaxID=27835 RepID=A0A0N4YC23_NIPBR|nr:unnamed protein product [Nippostrongylus brasiliensis]